MVVQALMSLVLRFKVLSFFFFSFGAFVLTNFGRSHFFILNLWIEFATKRFQEIMYFGNWVYRLRMRKVMPGDWRWLWEQQLQDPKSQLLRACLLACVSRAKSNMILHSILSFSMYIYYCNPHNSTKAKPITNGIHFIKNTIDHHKCN